ncbi:hypothetical protein [Streptomyces sp. JJ36]|uniref:hypothetical protein n=1 Tax=Streptomyces sp. JJ36 TaxID=2736645 RepID=UPI001F414F47|nr:hypothetical protein [Streptomyces sp. JJ36]MCF6522342.1 hypothetical protein [Streptomyces sp. JJ36]
MTAPGAEDRTSPGAAGPRGWRRARWVAPARVLAAVLAAVCVTALVGAQTVRSTVLDRGFYQGVLDEQRAYDRLYDEVLVDPEARPVTRSLLARLPVPESVVTANLKTVLPPATVRQLTDEQIAALVGYLRGDDRTLGVTVDLAPVLANVHRFAGVYLGELVSAPRGGREADMSAVVKRIDRALEDVAAGRRPADVPRVDLGDRAAEKVTSVLLSAVPRDERDALRPQVEGALRVGDVATALAAVGPHLPGSRARNGADQGERELLRITEGGRWNVVQDLESAGADLAALESARDVTRLALGLVQVVAVLAGLAAVAFLWLSGPPARTRRLYAVGWALAGGGALAAVAFQAVRWRAGALVWQAPESWPSSVAALVEDLERGAVHAVTTAGLSAALAPLLTGLLLVGAAVAWQRYRAARELPRRTRTGLLGGGAAVAAAALALGVALAPTAARGSDETHCNGSAELCELRYDQAAYLATHNAMSSTADRFISPLQDGDITTQLDEGARALLIDTHTWERADEIAERLRVSEFAPGMRREITGVINEASPARPGLWLCHAVCRGGAIPLVETLREIGGWMEDHPGEVVTLIVQDGITGEQTATAFEQAGLEDLLHTPDDDPGAAWPTLGEMVEENRRLVVFAERADGPAPWYRNFYRYGMETPYAFASPEEMSCAPHRGGTGKRLFLLNHFVTDAGGSRLAAGRVNAEEFVLDRARRCAEVRGRPVTFVAVDFANLGNARGAVETLNAARADDPPAAPTPSGTPSPTPPGTPTGTPAGTPAGTRPGTPSPTGSPGPPDASPGSPGAS